VVRPSGNLCLFVSIRGYPRRNQIQDFPALKLCRYPHSIAATLAALPSMSLIPFVPFLSDRLPLELMPVRLGPGQFEFEMRFCSVQVQRLSSFSVRRWTLSVRRFPGQFEFEMRFRACRAEASA